MFQQHSFSLPYLFCCQRCWWGLYCVKDIYWCKTLKIKQTINSCEVQAWARLANWFNVFIHESRLKWDFHRVVTVNRAHLLSLTLCLILLPVTAWQPVGNKVNSVRRRLISSPRLFCCGREPYQASTQHWSNQAPASLHAASINHVHLPRWEQTQGSEVGRTAY